MRNSLVEEEMNLASLHLTPHLGQQNHHLLLFPTQHSTEQPQREALESLERLHQVAQPNVFQALVFGPRSDRHLVRLGDDVGEAGVSHPALDLGTWARVAAESARCAQEGVDPLESVVVFGETAVVGVVLQVEVADLGPAVGLNGAAEESSVSRLTFRVSR